MAKRRTIKITQSTQQNTPIKDIVNGIVITKNNRYVKIIEVKPIPFYFKTIRQRNAIYDYFSKMLKSGPDEIQIKSVSLPADLSAQLDILNKEIAEETNDKCAEIDREYENKLYMSQATGITRRFFIIFSLKPQRMLGKKASTSAVIDELERMADTMISYLNKCGNKVVIPKQGDENKYIARLLYILLNRGKYQKEPFDEHLNTVYNRYFEHYKTTNFFIPPCDYISPEKINFTDKKYLTINDMHYKYAYIPSNGYDTELSAGWANLFSNTFVDVDVDIFLKRIEKDQVISNIRRNISYSLVGSSDASITSEAYDNANISYASGTYLKDGLSSGEDFYYMSTLVSVCDENAENLDFKMNELIKNARSNDFILKEISYETENAFKSTLPLCELDKTLYEKTKRNVLTQGAATSYLFTAFEINDEDGVYLGDDDDTGALIIADIFDTNSSLLTNSNVFICGQPGAGKTYSVSLLATRMRIKHIPIFIIAPEKQNEFKRLCNAVGGQFIEFGPGTSSRINIMEIFKIDEKAREIRAKIDGEASNTSQLAEKADAVSKFIQLLVGNITKEQEGLVNEAIYDTYAKFGISRDNESLWLDKGKKIYKKMPILSDLCVTLYEKSKTEPSLKNIYNILKTFVKTKGASFDGETNVDTNNDFVVFGLERLKSEDVALGVFQAMDFCWAKIRQDVTKRKALFIDEWWRMAKNKIAADYSFEIAKIIRAYHGAMVIATQQMSDIMLSNEEIGGAVLNNCDIKILMKMKENDAKKVQELMQLSNNEASKLIRNEKGHALLVYGTNKLQIKFVATKTEDELITTDPKQLEEMAKKKQMEEIKKKAFEKVKNAKDISNMLCTAKEFRFSDDVILYDTEQIYSNDYFKAIELIDSETYLKGAI